MIDTQQLSRETGYWPTTGNPDSLAKLLPRCGFDYRNPHTASNDAAMTIICAIQMVLPTHLKSENATGKSLQNIIDDIEVASKYQDWTWGTNKYCVRCGGYGHTKANFRGRQCYLKVKCAHCAVSQLDRHQKAAGTHRTECCILFAFKGPETGTVVEVGSGIVVSNADSNYISLCCVKH